MKKLYEEAKIEAIAKKIREKTGGNEAYTTKEMPNGIDAVFETGKKAQYDAFWDTFQAKGERGIYNYAFSGDAWTEDTFKPKYDLVPSQAYSMFMYHGYQRDINPTPIIDLKGALERAGVTLDTSKSTDVKRIFYVSSSITRIPTISFESCRDTTEAFRTCTSLVSIDKIILKNDGTNTFSNTFRDCPALTEVIFDGVIGQNGLDLHWSTNLSKESIKSIIKALSPKTEGMSITLSKVAKEAAFPGNEWDELLGGNYGEEYAKSNWTFLFI